MATRRKFIQQVSYTTLGLSAFGNVFSKPLLNNAQDKNQKQTKVSIFSKHLQWLDYPAMASVARKIGFDGIDLTVRTKGHVLPENVKTKLPEAVAAIRREGLEVYTVTTGIIDADTPHTEDIASTLHDLGIKFYRTNWFSYDPKISMSQNLSHFKLIFEKIVKLNERFDLHAAYQNHSGTSFGASIWDLWEVLKDFDPKFVGCQFDVRHATVEGSNSWVNDFKNIHPYIKTYNIKDFKWVKRDNQWIEENVPLGGGMVDFKKFFELTKQHELTCPVSLHCEYPLGGAEHGTNTLTIPEENVVSAIKQDLLKLRQWLM
jgi:sugar phosphate isomerase/epimerase